ncbi:Uu.00g134600.m01.CDS01 [Anthostomella pinea]|uniref:Uu.00g134600.m01.CDS01 n=1 Tax=Anthostomella pinea TaxID=933095 RepID=A0AAI8YKY7_9PEZI|nr:Uu.00g134600.m01.CDS01 [Anthostomella pinea]
MPGRLQGVMAAKSVAKSARSPPRFQNGDAIEINTDDEDDENDDDDDEDDDGGKDMGAAWADSPNLLRARTLAISTKSSLKPKVKHYNLTRCTAFGKTDNFTQKRAITNRGSSEYRINDRVVTAQQYNGALEA